MDSLDLPQDMLWPGKTEPLSPDHRCAFASSNLFLATAAQQLWPAEEDILLSCFDDLDDDSNTTTTTFGQQYQDVKEKQEDNDKSGAEDVFLGLIELKEEGQWMSQENMDLSLLAATALQVEAFPSVASVYPPISTIKADSALIEGTSNYVAATELLFNEIKTFCTDFEAASYQQMTPPQSPPTSPMFANQHPYGINNNQQQLQQPNFGYGANAPSLTSPSTAALLNHLQYEERSYVDMQLQSNDCLDKTFVIPNAGSNVQTETLFEDRDIPIAPLDTDQLALELIDDLLRNKTKDVHENYVLVNTQLEATEQQSLIPRMSSSRQSGNAAQMQEDSFDFCDDSATQFSTPSYGNSLASSPSRSGSPLDLEDSQDDDEWMPSATKAGGEKEKKLASGSLKSSSRRRPYERGGGELEKKSRKKEQNKNAATRYRQKKKHEVETILDEENRLKKTNKKLATQFNEARREMKYLRNLLRDMYKQNNIHI